MNMTKENWLKHIDIDTKIKAVTVMRKSCGDSKVVFSVEPAIQKEGYCNGYSGLVISVDTKASYISFDGKRVGRKNIATLYRAI
jgi:hypothetical protein